jgi:4-phytase/acid phosphatase/peptide/nickel transport system substrate-binding protein
MQANPLRPPPSRRTGTVPLRWPIAVLAAVLGLVTIDATAQKRGGAIVMGLEADVSGFDPLTVGIYGPPTVDVASVLFESLTRLDDAGKAVPRLALSWMHADDYRTWTFKLRPGVRFHDGTPFDANAVKWNFDRQKDPANKCRCAAYITHIRSVEVVDPLTVVYRLNNPMVLFPEAAARVSQNTAAHSPAAVAARGAEYNRNPVGTGPYRLKSWVAGDRIVVERNPDYWDAGKSYLDQITFRPLPDSPSRFASLLSGEVDVIFHEHFDHENLARARKDKRFVVHEAPGNGAFPVYALNTKAPPLDDLRVRQALSMAIDKQRLSRVLTGGQARPATNPYGDASWVKCSDDGALPHDPAKARALLADYGKPVEFKLLVTTSPRGRAFGQALQQFWKQVGATVEIEQIDQGGFIPRALKRQYQVIGWSIVDFPDPDPQTYANFQSASATGLANASNPEIDRMLDRARASSDQRVRSADYCEIGRMVNQQALWLWTFQNHSYAIAKAKVRGIPRKHGGVTDLSRAWLE